MTTRYAIIDCNGVVVNFISYDVEPDDTILALLSPCCPVKSEYDTDIGWIYSNGQFTNPNPTPLPPAPYPTVTIAQLQAQLLEIQHHLLILTNGTPQ